VYCYRKERGTLEKHNNTLQKQVEAKGKDKEKLTKKKMLNKGDDEDGEHDE